MATKKKGSPWFKFKVNDWITGDIQFVSPTLKGVFIDICAFYWSKECSLSYDKCIEKFTRKTVDKLVKSEVLKHDRENVFIDFLDEQWQDVQGNSLTNSKNGTEGALKRWGKKDGESMATAINGHSESMANKKRGDKIRGEENESEIPRATDQCLNLKDIFFQDLPNSSYINDMAGDIGVPVEDLRAKIPDFRKACRSEYFKMTEFVDHFKFWYQKRILFSTSDQKAGSSKDGIISDSYQRQLEQIKNKHNQ
jgi:hypothetical protein